MPEQFIAPDQPTSPTFLFVQTQFTLFDRSSLARWNVWDQWAQWALNLIFSKTAAAYPSFFNRYAQSILATLGLEVFYHGSDIECWAFLQFCNFNGSEADVPFHPSCQAGPRMDHSLSFLHILLSFDNIGQPPYLWQSNQVILVGQWDSRQNYIPHFSQQDCVYPCHPYFLHCLCPCHWECIESVSNKR